MPLTTADIQGLPEALQLLKELQQQLADLKAREERRLQDAQPWVLKSHANTFFIGKHGHPIDHKTFNRMVQGWMDNGTLIEGFNYQAAAGQGNKRLLFISKEFLKGQPKFTEAPAKLKKTA